MLGPIDVYTRHPNSLKEHEYLRAWWRDGKLTVTYVRHDTPDGEEFYAQEWTVECREPLVTERRNRAGPSGPVAWRAPATPARCPESGRAPDGETP